MLYTNIPYKFSVPWGSGAATGYTTNPIPLTTGAPAASQSLGFPPITAVPEAAGGVPPDVDDMNGLGYYTTAWLQWLQAGGALFYDAGLSGSIGGYPKGSILQSSSTATPGKKWLNLVDNNTTNPDGVGSANWTDETIAALGYTPVQQGGGTGQTTAKIAIGQDASNGYPRIAIGGTDLGDLVLLSQFGYAFNPTNFYQKLPSGLIIQGQSQILTLQTPTSIFYPVAFPTLVYGVWASLGSLTLPSGSNNIGVSAEPISSNLTYFTALAQASVTGTAGCWFLSFGR